MHTGLADMHLKLADVRIELQAGRWAREGWRIGARGLVDMWGRCVYACGLTHYQGLAGICTRPNGCMCVGRQASSWG